MSYGSKKQAIAETGLSASSLKRLRLSGDLQEGIHWQRFGSRKVLYVVPLIKDWIANRHTPQMHQQAIAAYLESLPSSQAVAAKAARKSQKSA